jgi:hypothetical protein
MKWMFRTLHGQPLIGTIAVLVGLLRSIAVVLVLRLMLAQAAGSCSDATGG